MTPLPDGCTTLLPDPEGCLFGPELDGWPILPEDKTPLPDGYGADETPLPFEYDDKEIPVPLEYDAEKILLPLWYVDEETPLPVEYGTLELLGEPVPDGDGSIPDPKG